MDIILECVCELPVKTSLYATLVGLVNCTRPEFCAALLGRAQSLLRRALKLGTGMENARSRILTRFLTVCATSRAVTCASSFELLQALVGAALSTADASSPGDDTWQPRSDFLVYISLAALPFAGQELADGDPEGLSLLLQQAGSYLGKRRVRGTPAVVRPLRCDLAGLGEDADAEAAEAEGHQDDSLEDLWSSISVCASTSTWGSVHLARTRVHKPFAGHLDGASRPHVLPAMEVPSLIPGLAPVSYFHALFLFPPRPRLRLLDPAKVESDAAGEQLAPVDRLVGEELISDTLWAWEDGARFGKVHQAAEQLAGGLPWGDNVPLQWILSETLFAHALALPRGTYKPVFIAALVKDLCTHPNAAIAGGPFPPAMAAVIRQCFNMGLCPPTAGGTSQQLLHPAAADSLCEVLALHVAATGMSWPWHRWSSVAALPAYHPRRMWLVSLLQRLRCLTYHARVANALPEELRPLLGPAPTPDGGWPFGDAANPVVVEGPSGVDGGPLARHLLALVKDKADEDAVSAAVMAAMEPTGAMPAGEVAAVLAHVLAFHGRKTITHLRTMLRRYALPLARVAHAAGGAAGDGGAAVVQGYARHAAQCHSPQALWIAAERLQAQGTVSPDAIVTWVFTPAAHPPGVDYSRAELWRCLSGTMQRVVADASIEVDQATAAMTGACDAKEYSTACWDAANAVMEAMGGDVFSPEVQQATAAEQAAAESERLANELADEAKGKALGKRAGVEALAQSIGKHFAAACAATLAAAPPAGDKQEAALAAQVGLYNAYTAFVARFSGHAGAGATEMVAAWEAAPKPVFPADQQAAPAPMETGGEPAGTGTA
jgi:nuclear cap-binding protein subunit 1